MSLEQIKLNLINQSSDFNNTDVLIFQKSEGTEFDVTTIAWKVIKNSRAQDYHPFTYSMAMEVDTSDAWGNYTPKIDAYPGMSFEVVKSQSGFILQANGAFVSPEEVETKNNLALGSIDANIYRDGKLLAKKTNLVPDQKAVFKFKPKLFIMTASQIEEGDVIDSAIISQRMTELPLLGLKSADIVMTGGGTGKDAVPFRFELRNINQ